MININYKSDFTLIFHFQGGIPSYSWRIEFYVDKNQTDKRHIASFDGVKYNNCQPISDSNAILIIFNAHNLGRGTLKYELIQELPDSIFPDGSKHLVSPLSTNIKLIDGISSDAGIAPELVAILTPILKGKDGQGVLTLDLTQLTYPAEGRKVAEEIAKGQPVSILIRVSSGVPARAVVQIEDTGVTYKLYTGSFEQSTTGERVSIHQLCYVLNKTDGTVQVEQCKLTTDLATADSVADCVKKKDILILNSNLSNI